MILVRKARWDPGVYPPDWDRASVLSNLEIHKCQSTVMLAAGSEP